jgi:hypothetical protein
LHTCFLSIFDSKDTRSKNVHVDSRNLNFWKSIATGIVNILGKAISYELDNLLKLLLLKYLPQGNYRDQPQGDIIIGKR